MLQAEKTINGSYGACYENGEWLMNVTNATGTVQINKEEIFRSGTRWAGHKVMGLVGSGSITGYKMSPSMIKRIGQVANDRSVAFVTELIMKLDDPDSPEGKQRVRYKGVQFDVINLMGYETNSLVTEETPFTFSGFEYLD